MDLLVGGLLEQPQIGSVLGPTLTCLLAHQFHTLRQSDRYWHENDIPPASFNKGKGTTNYEDLFILMFINFITI